MNRTVQQRIEQFHSRAIEQTRRAGLSAYLLAEDGRVVRISPDGKRRSILPGPISNFPRTA